MLRPIGAIAETPQRVQSGGQHGERLGAASREAHGLGPELDGGWGWVRGIGRSLSHPH